ncbi:MAG TPA: YkvA family protein [Gammaproteobacteria bacterium]|nr:YkvA family protein [Gammaproteobacteria bacterium]
MSLKVTFELADADLDHFRTVMRQARDVARQLGPDEVLASAEGLLSRIKVTEVPEFIRDRLERIRTLTDMVRDAEWKLPEADTGRVLNALAYFSEPEDLIPDSVPGLGFLDDAIMVELVVRELRHEIEAYQDFCAFRDARDASARRGEDQVTREEWLAARRRALQSRMRNRRKRERERRARSSGTRSPFRLF